MSRWMPCKRRDFIKKLRQLGFDGPFSGTRHQFMIFDEIRDLPTIAAKIVKTRFLVTVIYVLQYCITEKAICLMIFT